MSNQFDGYDPSTDQYLQMLRVAQRIEDKKLAELIRARLKRHADKILISRSGCEIIKFPNPWVPAPVLPEKRQMWPRQPVIQGLTLFGSYCSFVLLTLILGLG